VARVVVLSFKDNDAANAVVQQLLDASDSTQAGWGDRVAVLGTILASAAKVEAIVARPTVSCKCPGNRTRPMRGEYHRTERFGWWVHKCNRPHYTIVRDFIQGMLTGKKNLLDEFKKEQPQEETSSERPADLEGVG
jgi:hypothetical protein